MKDSLSVCCVCLKDELFENNPIVRCDYKNCATVVHKMCYGIQRVPDGAWFCQQCATAEERAARRRCELCPSRNGALKHTNKGGWCHIVCALFVPGAEFLNFDRLETISLDWIASENLNKICSICEKNNRLDLASIGACIQCIKSGCKAMFHVTCGQSFGLLTEIVSEREGVKYVAYCSHHKQKSKHDFTIRLSNSNNCSSFKNKLNQNPPQLEKSDEDCVTPQESTSFICKSISSKNPNISSSSSNINISSDSMSQDDDCSASEIYNGSKLNENKKSEDEKKSKSISSKFQSKKVTEKLEPPHIINEILSNDSLLPPPNQSYSDTIAKSEATIKVNQFQSLFDANNKSTRSGKSTVRTSKRQRAMLTSDIPQKREKILKSEQNQQVKDFPMKIEKIKKTKKLSNIIKAKQKDRLGKESLAPSIPRSLFHHMNSVTNVTTAGTSSVVNNVKTQGNTSCQSMEELLEWQWDQSGSLLMQQAEASDIASLLSCLHDLKNENEQLLSKQLKLSHRRDHLHTINAKLQLQLVSQSTDNHPKASLNVPLLPSTDFRANIPQTLIRQTQKTPSIEQQYNEKSTRPRPATEGNSLIMQQQTQQHQQRVDQSLNQQTLALLKHYQQQQQPMAMSSNQITKPIQTAGVSVSNLFSQTDLVALLNSQLHSQLISSNSSQLNTLSTNNMKSLNQDNHHITPNNGTNMEFLYQTLQHKSLQVQQQQQKYQPQVYYQNNNKLSIQSANGINFDLAFKKQQDK